MPAERFSFDDAPLPPEIVVDSSFIFEALIDEGDDAGRHAAARAFAQALRRAETMLVWSPLIWLEATQYWRKLYRRGALPVSDAETAADEAQNRARAFERAHSILRSFLRSFDTYEVQLGEDVLNLANLHAATYNLGSHDALVVAITSTTGVYDLAALDRDFRRVEHVRLWGVP